MTDINVDELIAEARSHWKIRNLTGQTFGLLDRLADALVQLQRERDEALAVIERAKAAYAPGRTADTELMFADPVWDALAAAPADALRERDAEKWDEGAEMGHRLYAEPLHIAQRRNPYREGADRG